MAKKNTDTVKAMLTPGEFVIKKESAKKIGYGKLDRLNETGEVSHMNKGGKVRTKKKEAKMPRGIGTYGSQVGRPPKKAKGYNKGGKVKEDVPYLKSDKPEVQKILDKGRSRFVSKQNRIEKYKKMSPKGGGGKAASKSIQSKGKKAEKFKNMQFGGKVLGGVIGGQLLGGSDDVEFDEDAVGGMDTPDRGPVRGYNKGGKVTSEGYAVHGASNKYKVGE